MTSVMRKIVERSLREAGIDLSEVFQAANGAEALNTLKDSPVDLILCDINMPVMDGIEFIKQLPAIESAKNVPVVVRNTAASESLSSKLFSRPTSSRSSRSRFSSLSIRKSLTMSLSPIAIVAFPQPELSRGRRNSGLTILLGERVTLLGVRFFRLPGIVSPA